MKYTFIISTILLVNKFAQCFPKQKDFELLIMHNNDMHSRFEETSRRSSLCKEVDKQNNNCYGGFARTAHLIRHARKAALNGTGPNVIYLNAGDTYTGTQWFSVHKAKIVAEFLNILRPDAVSFGNHEFDLKVEGVIPFIQAAKFPIVAANLNFTKEPTLQATNVTKSVILEVAGRQIGIIGYLTPETAKISAPQNVIFNSEVQSIKEESEELYKKGINIIIAVGHSGIQTDLKIAKEVPLVDVVIGGHSNTFLWNGAKPDLEEPYGPYPLVVEQVSGKKVYVAQAYAYTKYMGYLNVKFNQVGDVVACAGQPVLVNSSIPQDEDILTILEVYRPAVKKLDEEILGKTKVVLDGTVESCRFKECNFGNLIADAFVAFHANSYVGRYWTDAPIAVVNGGGVRNSIEPNNVSDLVTRGELIAAMPFDNSVVVLTLQGEDLLKTLEIGIRSNGETSRGELLQTSGLRVIYDISKPVGSRVVMASARCGACRVPVYEPVDPKQQYRVITTGFLEAGGDGHTVFKDKGYNFFTQELNDWDIVAWYITKYSPIYPEEDGRLRIISKDQLIDKSAASSILSYFSLIIVNVIVTSLVS